MSTAAETEEPEFRIEEPEYSVKCVLCGASHCAACGALATGKRQEVHSGEDGCPVKEGSGFYYEDHGDEVVRAYIKYGRTTKGLMRAFAELGVLDEFYGEQMVAYWEPLVKRASER